jgi:nucleotide-binding universal stress UspA family protein
MKKILVPCDFSVPAISAYRVALDLAAKAKGTVHVLHIVELPVLHDSVLMPALSFEKALLRELRDKAIKRFEVIAKKYANAKVKVVFHALFGAIQTKVDDYIRKNGIDQVVMGSHGASGIREVFLGSNAEKMIRQARVPVLIVKEYSKKPIASIVMPCSLDSDHQQLFFANVRTLQQFFNAKLHLVWINTPLTFTPDTTSRERLQYLATAAGLKNYTINVFSEYREEQGIIQFNKLVKGDMIAIGTHGRKGLDHVLLGSLSEDIANHATTWVWTSPLMKPARKGK